MLSNLFLNHFKVTSGIRYPTLQSILTPLLSSVTSACVYFYLNLSCLSSPANPTRARTLIILQSLGKNPNLCKLINYILAFYPDLVSTLNSFLLAQLRLISNSLNLSPSQNPTLKKPFETISSFMPKLIHY